MPLEAMHPAAPANPSITAVIPACGWSTRMEPRSRPGSESGLGSKTGSKLLLPFAESTVLGATCDALIRGGTSEIVVVVRDDDAPLRSWIEQHGLSSVINPQPIRGMLSSIQAGLESLNEATSSGDSKVDILVTPGDLPLLGASSVRAVLKCSLDNPDLLIVPTHGGRRGHPLLIPSRRIAEVFQLDLKVGLRQLLQRDPDRVREVAVDTPGIYLDIDTVQDYRKLLAM